QAPARAGQRGRPCTAAARGAGLVHTGAAGGAAAGDGLVGHDLVRAVHDLAGHRGEIRHRRADVHDSVRDVRDLSLPVSRAHHGIRRGSGHRAAARSADRVLRVAVPRDRARHPLLGPMRRVARAGRAAWRVVRVEARAKLNLGLAVGPRRADGYHELATIFQSVSLADRLTLRPRLAGFTLEVHSAREVGAVPRGRANLVLRAADLMGERLGIGGAAIGLDKQIPAGSGLGGASADAAGTLLGLARLYGLRPSRWRLMELGGRLGADVPFAILGGTALGLGRG